MILIWNIFTTLSKSYGISTLRVEILTLFQLESYFEKDKLKMIYEAH